MTQIFVILSEAFAHLANAKSKEPAVAVACPFQAKPDIRHFGRTCSRLFCRPVPIRHLGELNWELYPG
jgi:hypothetical protein